MGTIPALNGIRRQKGEKEMKKKIKIILLSQEASPANILLTEISQFLKEMGYYRTYTYPEHREIFVHTDFWYPPSLKDQKKTEHNIP